MNSDSNAIKIGKAKKVERRLKSLQTGSPADLELLSKIRFQSEQEAMEEEYRLHQKFKALNIRGEWFRYDSDLKKYLSSLKTTLRTVLRGDSAVLAKVGPFRV